MYKYLSHTSMNEMWVNDYHIDAVQVLHVVLKCSLMAELNFFINFGRF